MAQHWTSAQIQTALAKTVGNLKPYELAALVDATSRVPNPYGPDSESGSAEVDLYTVFPSPGLDP